MKTKSSICRLIAFPPGVDHHLSQCSAQSGKSFGWHVRQACIEYLEARGVDVSNLYNPEGQGVRSDLRKKKLTRKQIEAVITPPPSHQSPRDAKSA